MAVCKHCGTEIKDGLEYCPNCGQKTELGFGDFFEPDEQLEEEAYNIFDAPDEYDLDTVLAKELQQGEWVKPKEKELLSDGMEMEPDLPMEDFFAGSEEMDLAQMLGVSEADMTETAPESPETAEEDSLLGDMFGGMADLGFDDTVSEEEGLHNAADGGIDLQDVEGADFFALDDLFTDIEELPSEGSEEPETAVESGLEDLLAVSEVADNAAAKKKKEKKQEKKSFWKNVFGNVPVDPSKIKPELTPEELAEKKKKEAEEKKEKKEQRKVAAETKKENARRDKEDRERQKALKKEEKKAKKLLEAKLILEEMQETRINRVGATIVFSLLAILGLAIFFGSSLFGYKGSVKNAEASFKKALNNDVRYYTDAYNEIYGLEIKPEDQEISDKVLTVMFVNKQLSSYNSYMELEAYEEALHSLLKGLHRYEFYHEAAYSLGIVSDMDYVRNQILHELNTTFHVSEDESEVLRSMLEAAGTKGRVDGLNTEIDEEAARVYNRELERIIKACGLK